MNAVVEALEKRSRLFRAVAGFVLVILVGILDYLTGYEYSFALFYLAPIALLTWSAGSNSGLATSMLSAFTWYVADVASGQVYSNPAIHLWNTLIRFSFFVIVTLLLAALRRALQAEQALARGDFVTGAINARYFHDLARAEIERSRRYNHPFTLAYIDLDNFKAVNDLFGHSTGDEVLRTVAATLQRQVRQTDVVARVGGDEFAVLLTETGQEAAEVAISKIRSSLLAEVSKQAWPVTFSIGVVTYVAMPGSVDEMVKMADDLMYSVKTDTKNGVRYAIHAG